MWIERNSAQSGGAWGRSGLEQQLVALFVEHLTHGWRNQQRCCHQPLGLRVCLLVSVREQLEIGPDQVCLVNRALGFLGFFQQEGHNLVLSPGEFRWNHDFRIGFLKFF